ncbi:substrate-binding domain-containing protein [Deinococcus sedimenti]|uniref:HTH cro/C1-type domain-containing protein n=1 Tax=Deinococcus sedimenti TaxID=1867090 RepID=A0ABQ2S7Y9_9DEIO|nr:substrate-binding domain-containing protein [Deinococcus sedimenti]GGS01340.1 hypothetical protein GCM10008960_30020 [Deinococcus sedimenti]
MPQPASGLLRCSLRERREAAGRTAASLAAEVGVSRQALGRIESGGAVPSTLVALRLARALHCAVEQLFELGQPQLTVPLDAPPGTRVRLARLGAEVRAVPLGGEAGLHQPADGVVRAAAGPGRVTVDLLAPPGDLERTALVAGCDPALGLLCGRLGAEGRAAWVPHDSLGALAAAARGEVHVAGLHLGGGDAHRQVIARTLPGAALVRAWQVQQGLMLAPGNPLGVRGAPDLARRDLRLVTRAAGAGGRALLDRWFQVAGLSGRERAARHARSLLADSPLAAAALVARGEADAAPGPSSAARAHGLTFVPLHLDAFDLAVPERHLGHPGVQALLSAARSAAFLDDLRSVGGYVPPDLSLTRLEVS